MSVRVLPTLKQKLALIDLCLHMTTRREQEKLRRIRIFRWGSAAQNLIVDDIGMRLYGRDSWIAFSEGREVQLPRRT